VAPAGDAITGDTRLSAVAPVWFAERTDLSVNSARRYREVWEDHILAGVGGLRVREATVSRLDTFIKRVSAEVGPPTAKLCASVLSGIMGLATRHGATGANPMRDVAPVVVEVKEPRALTLPEVAALRKLVKTWQETPKRGRPPSPDLLDIVDLLLGTGARIGEVLAIRWEDVDLAAGTVTICGTIVMSDEKPRRPFRQPWPKGKKAVALPLPKFAVDTLLRRHVNVPATDIDAVFPSAAGTWRDPRNTRRTLDKVLDGTSLDWVTPHVFRKTVGTLISNEAGSERAAAQLSHKDDAVTKRHYIQPANVAPDSRAILDRLVE
jgi:integrase